MNAPDRLADLRINPDWAKLPLFDRSKWQRVRFGDVVENVNETCDPVEAGIDRYIGLEHLEPGSLHIRSWGNVADGTTFTRRARPGQMLFGKRRAYQRKVAVASFDAVVSGDIYVLAPKRDRLIADLLPFLCMSDRFFKHAVGTSAGSLSPRTNWSSLVSFEFDLPPLEQQAQLSALLAGLDTLETRHCNLLQDARKVRRVVTDEEISQATTEKSLPCSRVMTMQNGRPFPSADYQDDVGIRLIRPGNLGIDGYLNWAPSATVYLPSQYGEENKNWHIGPNQVLINLTAQSLDDGFMGRVCFTRNEDAGLLNQRIGRFLIRNDFLPEFIFRCLQTTRFRNLVESRCEGSKVRHIYFRHFEEHPIPNLALDQQQAICGRINALEETARHIDEVRNRCIALRSMLLGELFR